MNRFYSTSMPTTIHLPDPMLAAVDESARAQGISRSRYIARAVQKTLAAERRWRPEVLRAFQPADRRGRPGSGGGDARDHRLWPDPESARGPVVRRAKRPMTALRHQTAGVAPPPGQTRGPRESNDDNRSPREEVGGESRELLSESRAGETPGDDIMTEIIFEVTDDEVDGGYSASALGYGIHTQGDSVEEIRSNVKEAVECYFDETMPQPKLIRLHFVRDEVLVA